MCVITSLLHVLREGQKLVALVDKITSVILVFRVTDSVYTACNPACTYNVRQCNVV